MVSYVIVPGIDGSDERHWQSAWEAGWGASAVRTAPASWDRPDLEDWIAAVQTAYEMTYGAGRVGGRVLLVAHSLGCWAVAEWLERARPEGVAAFLVAPPDVRRPSFPRDAAPTFVDLSPRRLPCRSLLVAGDDDPYCDPATSASYAREWRAEPHLLAGHGHINSATGLGDWPAGRELLRTLIDP